MPDYELLQKLGEGNFGEVWLVYDRALDVRRAVKFVRPSRILDPTNFYREPRTLMELKHDNIVKVEDAGIMTDRRLYIAMEYFPRGSLDTIYKGKPVVLTTARKLICEVCWGLEYAHNLGYIHRDIKPGNILIGNNREAKLSDFGLATRVPENGVASPYGYLTHLAPEIFSSSSTTLLTDIYALGVTAYRIFNGDSFLPTFNTEEELIDRVLEGKYPDRTHYRPHIPRSLRQIINKAMHPNPTKRYQSATSFRHDLEAISLKCNWGWKLKNSGIVYRTTIGSIRIKTVVIKGLDGKFEIITTRKCRGQLERRVLKDCKSKLSLERMKSFLHTILSRYVIEGR